MQRGRDDQPDCADKFEDPEARPDLSPQRPKRLHPLAYFLKHKNLHLANVVFIDRPLY